MNRGGKTLSEMTREELWQLFPISLAEYNPLWKEWYADESRLLEASLPADRITGIQHIGSTAVGTIQAKPIVDIMVETKSQDDFPVIRNILLNAGYRLMSEDDGRISFNKGYAEQGFADRVFHLHLRKAAKTYRVRAVLGVGMSKSGSETEDIRKGIGLPDNFPLFMLQGGLDLARLAGPSKWIMSSITKGTAKRLSEKTDRTPDDDDMLDLNLHGGSRVSLENLAPVLDWYSHTTN